MASTDVVEIAGWHPDSAFDLLYALLKYSWKSYMGGLVFYDCFVVYPLPWKAYSSTLRFSFKIIRTAQLSGIFHFIQFPQRFPVRWKSWGGTWSIWELSSFVTSATVPRQYGMARVCTKVWAAVSLRKLWNWSFHSLSNNELSCFYFGGHWVGWRLEQDWSYADCSVGVLEYCGLELSLDQAPENRNLDMFSRP